jgi:plasmid stability protein
MATYQPNIHIPEAVLAALRERAEEQHRSVEEMAGELILRGLLHEQSKGMLEALQEYGESQAMKRYGRIPNGEEVASIVKTHRQARRR